MHALQQGSVGSELNLVLVGMPESNKFQKKLGKITRELVDAAGLRLAAHIMEHSAERFSIARTEHGRWDFSYKLPSNSKGSGLSFHYYETTKEVSIHVDGEDAAPLYSVNDVATFLKLLPDDRNELTPALLRLEDRSFAESLPENLCSLGLAEEGASWGR